MARKIISYELDTGETIAVEVAVAPAEAERIAARGTDVVESAGQKFSDALKTAQRAATEVVEAFTQGVRPDELEVTFGLKMGGKLGVIVTEATTEANFQIKVRWVRRE